MPRRTHFKITHRFKKKKKRRLILNSITTITRRRTKFRRPEKGRETTALAMVGSVLGEVNQEEEAFS